MCAAKLKPCPFCGSEECSYSTSTFTDGRIANYMIECHDCAAFGPESPSQEIAEAKWNSRAELEEKSPIVQQLKAEILPLAKSIRICIKERKYQYAINRIDDILAKLSAV